VTNKKDIYRHRIDIDLISDDSIILDVGVCRGETTRALRNAVGPAVKIYMFEPARNNIINYVIHLVDENTILVPYAIVGKNIWRASGFIEYKHSIGWSNINNMWDGIRNEETTQYTVPTVPINSLTNFLNVDVIDYIQFDVEGMEKEIVDNMTLETADHIIQFSMEVHRLSHITPIRNKLETLGYLTEVNYTNELYAIKK